MWSLRTRVNKKEMMSTILNLLRENCKEFLTSEIHEHVKKLYPKISVTGVLYYLKMLEKENKIEKRKLGEEFLWFAKRNFPKVVVLVGYSGSGKSTVAYYFYKKYHYKILNVGDLVEELSKGKDVSKFSLKLKNNKRLLNKIEKNIETNTVVDGVREPYIIKHLKKKYSAKVFAIFCKEEILKQRLRKKGLDEQEIQNKLLLDKQLGIEKSFKFADYKIVDNDYPLLKIFEQVDKIMLSF